MAFFIVNTTGVGVVTFTDTGLTSSTLYTYEIQAVDSLGAVSSLTSPFSATTSTASFTVVNTTGAGVLTFTDTGLIPSTLYTYEIQAVDSLGVTSALTAPFSATTSSSSITVPSGFSATPTGSTTIQLNWLASTGGSGIIHYVVQHKTGAGSFVTIPGVGVTGVGILTIIDSLLTPSTIYQYQIQAVDSLGASSNFSPTISATTLAQTFSNPSPHASDSVSSVVTKKRVARVMILRP